MNNTCRAFLGLSCLRIIAEMTLTILVIAVICGVLFGFNFAIYNDVDKAFIMVVAEIVIGFFGCMLLSWVMCWCIPNTRREFADLKKELDSVQFVKQELAQVV